MRMFLISDNVDTLTGMRLAGIEGVVVHEKQEIKQALDEVLFSKRYWNYLNDRKAWKRNS